MSTFGYFDDAAREYVITRPNTPRPWSNYMGSAEFGGVITNNAAGYTFYKSAARGRLTRFRFNAAPGMLNGRFLYLRDKASGDYWTNSWMPVAKPLDRFQSACHHGIGYTRIDSTYSGIRSEVTYFIPMGALYEVWEVVVTNQGASDRELTLFPFIEPQCNWSAEDDNTNLQYNQYILATQYVDGLIDIGSNVNMPEDPENFINKDQKRHSWFGLAGIEADNFDADLTAFLGDYGTYANPQAVTSGHCSGKLASGDMGCASFQLNITLQPGESRRFAVLYGVGQAATEGKQITARMQDTAARDEALEGVKTHWSKRLQSLSATTPDAGFNSMLNTWAPYNSLMTFYWSRTASLVYAGERDGLGYRDSVQDIVAAASLVTDEATDRLTLLITGQYSNGGAKPIVEPFNHTPGQEALPDHFRADDCLWLFNAVPAYVKETGDIKFYRTVLPYADTGEASVLGHLRRAIEFNLERSGAHNLPCGLHADWNDCLRLGEKGESVFVAFQLRLALKVYIEICQLLGEADEKTWAESNLKTLDQNLETYAWDGEWYLRAYRYDGFKFGSRESDEGKIFMNPQTWSVLSGHATGERAEQVMQAMDEHLATEYGIMICTPPYVKTDPQVSLARLFNPGMKENGGIFNHTQGWGIMAAALIGKGDLAWEYLQKVMPSSYNDRAEVRQVEPYVVCQSTHSPASPRYGAGRVSWLSGSATWNYFAMSYSILGIQADYEGLRLDPCIPSQWKSYTATRFFRGKEHRITVHNPKGVCRGVAQMRINDQPVEGNLVKTDSIEGEIITIEVHLG